MNQDTVERVAPDLRQHLGSAIAAALALTLCAVVVARSRFTVDGTGQFTLIDDAMISLRYARNLANGNGLVWNVGEPPVEGFSNLGYTLLMVPGFILGDNAFSRYLPVCITIAALIATSLLASAITRVIWPGSLSAPVAAGVMVALDFGLVFWTARGMEVTLITAAVSAMTLQLFRWRQTGSMTTLWWAAGFGAVATVLRLDALVPVLTLAAWLIACELVSRRSAREAFIIPAVAIVTALIIVVFQTVYFGDALPNTFRLKVGGVSPWERVAVGWDVLIANAWPQLLVLTLLGPVLLALCSFKTFKEGNAAALLALGLTSTAYSVWVGGDYAEPQVHAPNRFILVGIPALSILAAVGAAAAASRIESLVPNPFVAPVLSLVAVVLVLQPNYDNLRLLASRDIPLLKYDQQWTALGLHLRATLPSQSTIATHVAGQIPYYSGLRTIDLLGKSDRQIASIPQTSDRFRPGHNKWDYDYGINESKPDVVADEWGDVSSYLESNGGYVRLPNGLWVSATPRVPIDTDKLGACYWQCGGTPGAG